MHKKALKRFVIGLALIGAMLATIGCNEEAARAVADESLNSAARFLIEPRPRW